MFRILLPESTDNMVLLILPGSTDNMFLLLLPESTGNMVLLILPGSTNNMFLLLLPESSGNMCLLLLPKCTGNMCLNIYLRLLSICFCYSTYTWEYCYIYPWEHWQYVSISVHLPESTYWPYVRYAISQFLWYICLFDSSYMLVQSSQEKFCQKEFIWTMHRSSCDLDCQ